MKVVTHSCRLPHQPSPTYVFVHAAALVLYLFYNCKNSYRNVRNIPLLKNTEFFTMCFPKQYWNVEWFSGHLILLGETIQDSPRLLSPNSNYCVLKWDVLLSTDNVGDVENSSECSLLEQKPNLDFCSLLYAVLMFSLFSTRTPHKYFNTQGIEGSW